MQARLADAEAKARMAEVELERWKQKVEETPKKEAGSDGGGASSAEVTALKQENEELRGKLAKISNAAAPGIDVEAIEKAFTDGVRERRKEWKEALADYKVLSYETPEVTAEDVKPFRTNLSIKLEQAGRTFVAQVPVAADFQGNWSFPSPAEVLGYAKKAQLNESAPSGSTGTTTTPGGTNPTLTGSSQSGKIFPVESGGGKPPPPPTATTSAPRPRPAPDVQDPVPFGGKTLQTLKPIKFPGDP